TFLATIVGPAVPAVGAIGPAYGRHSRPYVADAPKKTEFQIACMTLPYSRFPLARALEGIKAAGYTFVAWGTSHKENGKDVPVIAKDASPATAKELGKRCRDMGLEPVMMFSGIYPEAKDGFEVHKQRLLQAG